MADGITITKEHRKIAYRTVRLALWSLIATLAVLIPFGVNPFGFWNNPVHLVLVFGGWIIAYHVMEALKRRA